ncbi:hypothetical protein [Ideonella sp. A 288]|uniref:hypothetical protein n=1 Tax=Ideonella sp. A 288 TaxID=1962181 RepID=UPI0011859D72|nr:hypothetical protein [Ideonella sp. A 288]
MDLRLGCTAATAGLAWASIAIAQPAVELELPSCVAGSPPLRVSSSAEQAWLQAADRRHFHEAAQARYALYQRSGTEAPQVLMLRRGRHWQYVTLLRRAASGLCFTAVFAADRFDFTAEWIAKYKPRAIQPDD